MKWLWLKSAVSKESCTQHHIQYFTANKDMHQTSSAVEVEVGDYHPFGQLRLGARTGLPSVVALSSLSGLVVTGLSGEAP